MLRAAFARTRLHPGRYSPRSTRTGSVRAARRAGIAVAIHVSSTTIVVAVASTTGPDARTPNRTLDTARPPAYGAAIPIATPTAISQLAAPHHQPEHFAESRPERQPRRDLAGPLRRGIGDHAVDPDRRQRQRRRAEHRHQGHPERRSWRPWRRAGIRDVAPDPNRTDVLRACRTLDECALVARRRTPRATRLKTSAGRCRGERDLGESRSAFVATFAAPSSAEALLQKSLPSPFVGRAVLVSRRSRSRPRRVPRRSTPP